MAKVSVIVPIYKVENYMGKCIDSLLRQSLTDIEIILVDDGSPDRCGEMCDEYKSKDERIKVIHKVNGGLSDARNAGLKIATGDFIGFVDSDDYVASDMFERLFSICVKNNVKIAGCDLAYVYDGSDAVPDCRSTGEEIIMSSQAFFKKMLYVQEYLRTGVWNKIYAAELFADVRFPKGKIYEDVGTMYKLIFQVKEIAYISYPGYFYLKAREGAITNQKYSVKEYDRLEMNTNMVNYILENQPSLAKTAIGYRAVNCNLSIVNSMIASETVDPKILSFIRQDLNKYFFKIMLSDQVIWKKIQILLLMLSYRLYTVVYKKMKLGT